jgi:signal transduction histidine kinase
LSKAEIIDLKSEQKMMDSFISKLSHDLRTPLMISRAASELAGRYIHEPEKAHMYIDKSVTNIDRTARMINELLDARKLKAGGKLNLNINSWDMVRLVKNVCHDYEVLGAHIHFHCDQSELKGYWDGDGVRRIMENLIGNAMKYGDRNYPVDVNVIDLDDSVCLKVHNMGNVIRPEEKISIFDQFTRADSARKKGKGWGIGLSLVKGVTEAHGGTVEVESYPVDGTTFVINLPKSNHQDSGSASFS